MAEHLRIPFENNWITKNILGWIMLSLRWVLKTGLIVLIAVMVGAGPVWASNAPVVDGLAAVLMDVETGEVLYAKNPHLRCPPASTTKIVTALLALERGELDCVVTVSLTAAEQEGSSVWLMPGEEQRLRDLIYGLMLGSGNDAATAIAETLAGSEKKFAVEMTKLARRLGAKNTRFRNASGLPAAGHYTTAYDLALITCHALKNPEFAMIVQTRNYTLPGNRLQKERLLYNHNKLLWRYEYADGVKTGYTRQAGSCLVASATKDGHRLVSVVFRSKHMYDDSQALLEYGFDEFRLVKLTGEMFRETAPVQAGVTPSVAAIPGRDIMAVVPADAVGKVRVKTMFKPEVEAPVTCLEEVGQVQLYLGDKLLDAVPLLAAEAVPRRTFLFNVISWFRRLFVDKSRYIQRFFRAGSRLG